MKIHGYLVLLGYNKILKISFLQLIGEIKADVFDAVGRPSIPINACSLNYRSSEVKLTTKNLTLHTYVIIIFWTVKWFGELFYELFFFTS